MNEWTWLWLILPLAVAVAALWGVETWAEEWIDQFRRDGRR